MALATFCRKFDVSLAPSGPDRLEFKDAFLPAWTSSPVMVKLAVSPD